MSTSLTANNLIVIPNSKTRLIEAIMCRYQEWYRFQGVIKWRFGTTRVDNKQIKSARFSLVTTFIGLVLPCFGEFNSFDLFVANSGDDWLKAIKNELRQIFGQQVTIITSVISHYSRVLVSGLVSRCRRLQRRTFMVIFMT